MPSYGHHMPPTVNAWRCPNHELKYMAYDNGSYRNGVFSPMSRFLLFSMNNTYQSKVGRLPAYTECCNWTLMYAPILL